MKSTGICKTHHLPELQVADIIDIYFCMQKVLCSRGPRRQAVEAETAHSHVWTPTHRPGLISIPRQWNMQATGEPGLREGAAKSNSAVFNIKQKRLQAEWTQG